jgi:hypothetical protein
MTAHEAPFLQPVKRRWLPVEMMTAPTLPDIVDAIPIEPRYALLLNPFYRKDPSASFGKHVLTPSLALTSFAATTPDHWKIRYWDENLLDGPPPLNPIPQVVGITVHLTFATRAYELADWYRSRGSTVILGGLHVLSCPEECAPHADSLALGDGVQLWPRILNDIEHGCLQSRYSATYENDTPTIHRHAAPSCRGTASSQPPASLRLVDATTGAGSAIWQPKGCGCRIACVIPS